MRYFLIGLVLFLFTACVNTVFADSIILKNGIKIEGKIVDQGDDYLKIKMRDGAIEIYNLDEVKYIKKEPDAAPPEQEIKQTQAPKQPVINAGSEQKGSQARELGVPAEGLVNNGPYDKELNSLNGNMNDIIKLYQQAIGQAQNAMMPSSAGGDMSTANAQEVAAGILKQYQNAMGDLDKTTQDYQEKK